MSGERERLEYLRGELRAERISWGELAELAELAPHIDPDDVELLEAAGVPEFEPERPPMQSLTLHYLEDLGVTAVDTGGPYIHLFACEPGDAIAPTAQAFHVVNAWDYGAGRRREFAPGELEADIREAVEAYQ